MNSFSQPKTFLVHDWIDAYGGAERCCEVFVDLFRPEKFFTLLAKPDSSFVQRIQPILVTSPLQNWPFAFSLHRYLLGLYPSLIEKFDVSDAEIVLSSSHCVAKGALTRSDQLHIAYIHTPPRYLWDQCHDYVRANRLRGLKRWYAEHVFHQMRIWDVTSSNRVNLYIANSHNVARRISHAYRRPAIVVHPFVDLTKFARKENIKRESYFVVVSRLVSQKRVDIAVNACSQMGAQLKIIGEGPEFKMLRGVAGKTIQFLGHLSDAEMVGIVQASQGLIFCPEEDFGMVPIEAQALGVPVLAFGKGGALETVVNGKTGEFFARQSADCLVEAIRTWDPSKYDSTQVVENASRFSRKSFESKMRKIVELAYESFRSTNFDDLEFVKHWNLGN